MEAGFFDRPAPEVARALIGVRFTVAGVGGVIVETEAYDRTDAASHSFGGPTARNAPMFGNPGRAYVYRIYGLHWCFNVVCDASKPGSAVLVRALEPTSRVDTMSDRRGPVPVRNLCAGPGRLCQALGIDARLNGADLSLSPFEFETALSGPLVAAGPRIGITKGADTPWRFGLAGSPFLSRPMS